jgi:transposase-like protein
MKSSTVADMRPYTHRKSCPQCGYSIEYWWTSGMSESFPHFYCDTCSNVLWRRKDQEFLLSHETDDESAIAQIADSLPHCKCGGRFMPWAGPKCPKCKYEFKRDRQPSYELRNPNMILLEGAEMLTED